VSVPRFTDQFAELFRAHHPQLLRVLVRLSGEPELAADVTQEAFVSLYRRGSMPETPEAWLVTVALNRLRNERAKSGRHARKLGVIAGAFPSPSTPTLSEVAEARSARHEVRAALETLDERERQLLVLRSEGYSYRDIAAALSLNGASVGTLLARARRAFLAAYGESDASR
jgi:RNA polymerase sigma-70 factor (ECF subfamily)